MKNKKRDGFFVTAFSVSVIVLVVEINLALIVGPAVLCFITEKWTWALLYTVTLPIALFIPAGIQRARREKR